LLEFLDREESGSVRHIRLCQRGAMATTERSVTVERTQPGRFVVTNDRGGRITIGTGADADFTPTELLLAAIGGCTAIDVDILTSRRAEPDAFAVGVRAGAVIEMT